MKARALTAAVFAATTLFSAVTYAQAEGQGVNAGGIVLHPGIAGEFGYDSNYFQRSDDEGTPTVQDEPVIDVLRFRLTPSLSLETAAEQPGGAPPKATISASLSASYNEFIPLDSATSDEVRDQRHVSAAAGFNLDVLPKGEYGVDFLANFVRLIEPSNSPDTSNAFDRDTLRFGAGFNWRPGGGLFNWRLGYEGRVTFFEKNAFEAFNNVEHYAKTRGRWRFLPRTALMFDAEYGFINYTNASTQADSNPVRAKVGLNGLITYHMALLAMVGWGASFYEGAGPEYDSLLAQVELKWFLQPKPTLESTSAPVGLSSVAVGFTRDFINSYLANYFTRNRAYLGLDYLIAGRVVVGADVGYSRIDHPASFRGPGLEEDRVDVLGLIEYLVTQSVALTLTGRYDASLGENLIETAPGSGAFDNIEYQRFQIFLGARWFL